MAALKPQGGEKGHKVLKTWCLSAKQQAEKQPDISHHERDIVKKKKKKKVATRL